MNNNIFYKNINKKYNPDIESKYKNKESERLSEFELTNIIYNPITNIIPTQIKSSADLILENVKNNDDFKKLLIEKEKERLDQELYYFKDNNKSIPPPVNYNSVLPTENKTFNDLQKLSNNNNNNTKSYNNLLTNLKDLGIII